MKLSLYVRDIDNIYTDLRGRYATAFEKIDKLDAEINELKAHRNDYQPQAYDERLRTLKAEIADVNEKEILPITKEYNDRTAAVRAKAKQEFARKYQASPCMVDNNAITLLRSGLLTDDELRDMAQNYTSNTTMMRLIGDAIRKRGEDTGNDELRNYGAAVYEKSRETPHLSTLDGFISLARNGLRTSSENASEARSLSDGYNDTLYSSQFAKYAELADGYDSI